MSRRLTSIILVSLALALLITNIFFSFVLPLTPGRLARTSAPLIEHLPIWSSLLRFQHGMLEQPEAVALLILLFAVIAFGSYGLAIFLSLKLPASKRTLTISLIAALVLLAVSVLAMPNFNSDIFDYILSGRVGAVYQSNPHYVAADQFPDDPIYPYANHQYTHIPGVGRLPTWTLLSIPLAWIAGNDPVTNLVVYRLALMGFNLLNLLLIISILRRIKPELVVTGVIVYGWSPIVTLLGQTKSDSMMVFLLLLSVWWLFNSKKRLAVISLTLSAFIKLLTLPLLIVYCLQKVRMRQWRLLLLDIFLIGATVLLIYLPFMEDPWLILRELLYITRGGSSLPDSVQIFFIIGFVALVLYLGLTQTGSNDKLLNSWVFVLLFFSIFLTQFTLAWYLMALIGLISISLHRKLLALTWGLSFAAFVLYIWETTSTPGFQLPSLEVHRLYIYLIIPVAVIGFIIARRYWRTRSVSVPGWAKTLFESSS